MGPCIIREKSELFHQGLVQAISTEGGVGGGAVAMVKTTFPHCSSSLDFGDFILEIGVKKKTKKKSIRFILDVPLGLTPQIGRYLLLVMFIIICN